MRSHLPAKRDTTVWQVIIVPGTQHSTRLPTRRAPQCQPWPASASRTLASRARCCTDSFTVYCTDRCARCCAGDQTHGCVALAAAAPVAPPHALTATSAAEMPAARCDALPAAQSVDLTGWRHCGWVQEDGERGNTAQTACVSQGDTDTDGGTNNALAINEPIHRTD